MKLFTVHSKFWSHITFCYIVDLIYERSAKKLKLAAKVLMALKGGLPLPMLSGSFSRWSTRASSEAERVGTLEQVARKRTTLTSNDKLLTKEKL